MDTTQRGLQHVAEDRDWFHALMHLALQCLYYILRANDVGAAWVNHHHII